MTSVLPVLAGQIHHFHLQSQSQYARTPLRDRTSREQNMTGRGRAKGKGKGKGKTTTKAQTQMQTQTRARVVDFGSESENVHDGGFTARSAGTGTASKRKAVEYEEDIEGFQFSRAPGAKRLRSSPLPSESESVEPVRKKEKQPATRKRARPPKNATEDAPVPAKTRTRTRTQTQAKPKAKQREVAVAVEVPAPTPAATNGHVNGRRSKRLAELSSPEKEPTRSRRRISSPDVQPQPIQAAKKRSQKRKPRTPEPEPEPGPADDYIEDENDIEDEDEDGDVTFRVQAGTTSTKIALPMADTPVIRKNKEMRMKDKKKGGQRRSSLGMRGRRASSLIDSGVSNALPHDAVRTADFYKHIEGEGLPEPRRMKQLLTWCATRALGAKPSGSRNEDESARLAARVIQEELLKELGSRSELSDWFSRQESTPPPVVVKKPNPKNVQNAEKLRELEEHIQRLQEERKSLAALLKDPATIIPPPVTNTTKPDEASTSTPNQPPPPSEVNINPSLLDPSQRDLLTNLNLSPNPDPDPQTQTQTQPYSLPALSTRLSSLSLSLAPTLDSFASGIHDIELYGRTAGEFAGAVLRVCARRLEERDERVGEKVREKENGKAEEDLSVVVGALGRLERRM